VAYSAAKVRQLSPPWFCKGPWFRMV
jgi:hypothetical protein